VRARAANALIEVGEKALPSLETVAKSAHPRGEIAGDLIEQIRWHVDLAPRSGRLETPDPDLLDVTVFGDFGLPSHARRNACLVPVLVRKIRESDVDAKRPTGQTPKLTGGLYALDQLREGLDTDFDAVERRADALLLQFRGSRERGRIFAAVAHVYGQSGCRPRTTFWTQRALALPLDPALRLRMYEYAYSATLLRTRTKDERDKPQTRRALLRPALFGLREALRYDLPAKIPTLPGISLPRDRSAAAARQHRRQVQARVVGRWLGEMTSFRDIHLYRVAKHATRTAEERQRLRTPLSRPEVLQALARALRDGEDMADGLRIAREAKTRL
jgi:hypothetical protein